MQDIVNTINAWVWSPALIYLALGTGLFFSILTRFVQIRMFREMIHLLFSSKESERGISSFQALAVSLSGRVGTGNIAGVAAAIGFGGPGAVFWMWVVAFLGASTAYVEATLGQIYKEVDEGQYRGGPAFYIEKAMGQRWYGCDLCHRHNYCIRLAASWRTGEQHHQCRRGGAWHRRDLSDRAWRHQFYQDHYRLSASSRSSASSSLAASRESHT